jgi:hypothetical protein
VRGTERDKDRKRVRGKERDRDRKRGRVRGGERRYLEKKGERVKEI